jgi:ABC-type phosphate transport system substrate-binding protein
LKRVESIIRRAATTLLILAASALLQMASAARGAPTSPKLESLAIIINQSNPVDELSLAELRTIFLGERSHWPNGRRITLVMMEQGQPEREVILRDICRLSEADFRRRILQGLFTGEVLVSPKTLATPVGVRKFVFNLPGAIGYLRPEDVDGSVKVVRVDGHLPRDAEYALRIPAVVER